MTQHTEQPREPDASGWRHWLGWQLFGERMSFFDYMSMIVMTVALSRGNWLAAGAILLGFPAVSLTLQRRLSIPRLLFNRHRGYAIKGFFVVPHDDARAQSERECG